MVNLIKQKALPSHLFSALCKDKESEHPSLLFHSVWADLKEEYFQKFVSKSKN